MRRVAALLVVIATSLAVGAAAGMTLEHQWCKWQVDGARLEADNARDQARRALAVASSCRDSLARSTTVAARVFERQLDQRRDAIAAVEQCRAATGWTAGQGVDSR